MSAARSRDRRSRPQSPRQTRGRARRDALDRPPRPRPVGADPPGRHRREADRPGRRRLRRPGRDADDERDAQCLARPGIADRGRCRRRSTRNAARRSRRRTSPTPSSASGVVDVAIGCGVELMSQVPMGSTIPKDPFVGKPVNKSYWEHHELTSQFEGAERIAKRWGITRRSDRCLRPALPGARGEGLE